MDMLSILYIAMSVAKLNEFLLDKIKTLALSPYRFVHIRNTHDPIVAVLNATDSADCKTRLERF